MAKEHKQLTSLLTDARQEHDGNYEFVIGSLGQNTLILMQCGMGKVNAAVGTTVLIRRYHPDCVVSTGCAGGIDASLNVMDVVVSTATVYHDVTIPGCEPGQMQGLPARYQADSWLLEKARSLDCGVKIHPGLIVTGDWFVDSRDKMREIVGHFPEAKAVDMESCAIAQTCYINKVKFISFRVISDIPLRDTDASQYHNFWDTIAANSFQVTKTFVESLWK
jgi:adenosylhomocysteine nucleosidase